MDAMLATGLFTLGGVIVGAGLRELSVALGERRSASREAKGAARLLGADLLIRATEMRLALGLGGWLPLTESRLSMEGWQSRATPLASSLSRQEWRLLRITMRRLKAVEDVAGIINPKSTLSDQDVEKLTSAADMAYDAYLMLEALAEAGLFSRKRPRPTPEQVRAQLFLEEPDLDQLRQTIGTAHPDKGEDKGNQTPPSHPTD